MHYLLFLAAFSVEHRVHRRRKVGAENAVPTSRSSSRSAPISSRRWSAADDVPPADRQQPRRAALRVARWPDRRAAADRHRPAPLDLLRQHALPRQLVAEVGTMQLVIGCWRRSAWTRAPPRRSRRRARSGGAAIRASRPRATVSGQAMTAVELQQGFLDEAAALRRRGRLRRHRAARGGNHRPLEDTLAQLRARNFEALASRVEAGAARWVLDEARRRRPGSTGQPGAEAPRSPLREPRSRNRLYWAYEQPAPSSVGLRDANRAVRPRAARGHARLGSRDAPAARGCRPRGRRRLG
jgi:hypothetical protein